MPPARTRPILDDTRSETSSHITTTKDRANTGAGISKPRRSHLNPNSEPVLVGKPTAVARAMPTLNAATNGTSQAVPATQTDWSSVPVATLHTYRSAYKIHTPSSYTQPHADLLYKSSEIGQRAPSQVLARKTQRDLKLHRRKMAQLNGQVNGIYKRFKQKEKDRDDTSSQSSQSLKRKVKELNQNMDPLVAQSIEPSSPTVVSQSADSNSDHASSTLLNASDPESTLIGRQSPSSLATTVRKHFNAQQLNEADTIAKFTYVVRQQGYGSGAAANSNSNANTVGAVGNNFVQSQKVSIPVSVEGSAGDGEGWIMGSMGRQVRMSDTGGGAAFRRRFRP